VGLDPGTPGPRPEPKAGAQPTEPPRRPVYNFLKEVTLYSEGDYLVFLSKI